MKITHFDVLGQNVRKSNKNEKLLSINLWLTLNYHNSKYDLKAGLVQSLQSAFRNIYTWSSKHHQWLFHGKSLLIDLALDLELGLLHICLYFVLRDTDIGNEFQTRQA